jgi:hypothetical protein
MRAAALRKRRGRETQGRDYDRGSHAGLGGVLYSTGQRTARDEVEVVDSMEMGKRREKEGT